MVEAEIGDYNNELQKIYGEISIYKTLGEEKYRDFGKLKKDEYLFSQVPLLRKFEERYPISELKEILQKTPKEKLKKVNSIIMKINSGLKNKSKDISKFEKLLDEAISTIRN